MRNRPGRIQRRVATGRQTRRGIDGADREAGVILEGYRSRIAGERRHCIIRRAQIVVTARTQQFEPARRDRLRLRDCSRCIQREVAGGRDRGAQRHPAAIGRKIDCPGCANGSARAERAGIGQRNTAAT